MPILAVLGFVTKNWKLFALAALALAVVGWITGTQYEISHLKKVVDADKVAYAQLVAANQTEHATVLKVTDELTSEHATCTAAEDAAKANLTIAQQTATKAQARAVQYGNLLDAIKNAPPSADGPVSPILRSSVDGLWDDPSHP